jgi:hypothetical protein
MTAAENDDDLAPVAWLPRAYPMSGPANPTGFLRPGQGVRVRCIRSDGCHRGWRVGQGQRVG